MGDVDIDFFLETLKQLIMSSKDESIIKEKNQLESLEENIKYMRGFLKVTEKKRNEHSEVMNLVRRIKDVVLETENIVERFAVQALKVHQNRDHLSLDLESVKKDIKTLTFDVKQFCDENRCDIYGVTVNKFEHPFSRSEGGSSSSRKSNTSKVAEENVVIGFKEEVERLMGKLKDSGMGGPLEIISIVGAAGSGKTTLAREVYNHRSMSNTFEYRAWVNVSQGYDKTMKRKLLTRILEFASPNKKVDYEKIREDTLGEDTHKCLKSKKYLIVMDDIWDTKAWDDIQRSLPREGNGNKVLFTSRQFVEPKSIHCFPHYLHPLPHSYSLELLQNKVFRNKCCPPELVGVSEQIAKKCEGLPLAIVTIAGILAVEDKTRDLWEEVSKHLSSIITKKQYDYMEILELSYNQLPRHLKACFVYIGGFPKDSEILVRELIWLWIAKGFIHQSKGSESLEDVAKDYLWSLIERSLVTVARRSSSGGIKACRIHDLWRKLCLKKAEEDNDLVKVYGNDAFTSSLATNRHRLFISSQFVCKFSSNPCTQNLRSFLCLNSPNSNDHFSQRTLDNSSSATYFHLLKVLDDICAECQEKIGKGHLLYLRYLALRLPYFIDIKLPFSYLLNLETLKLQVWKWTTIPLPHNIFKMVKLRHLYAKRGVFNYHFSCLSPDVRVEVGFDLSSKLDSLQTLHAICPCEECRNFLVKTPNLRKLGFYGELISDGTVLMLPNLEFLKCLEKLSIENSYLPDEATTLPPVLKFPQNITQLTLKYTSLKWEELSILQTMPSLEVLKLLNKACSGRIWNTIELDQEFSTLKYLRLEGLKIVEWNASSDQFPKLEVLKVNDCFRLRQIPRDFANLNELCKIEVKRCSFSTVDSAMKIREVRRNSRGDDGCIDLLAEHTNMEEPAFDNGILQFYYFLIFISIFPIFYLFLKFFSFLVIRYFLNYISSISIPKVTFKSCFLFLFATAFKKTFKFCIFLLIILIMSWASFKLKR